MGYDNENLKRRTKRFALDIIKLVQDLPSGMVSQVLGRQLLKSGTSVGANYRAACRAKSAAAFISKLGDVEEEADESGFWMELLSDAGIAKGTALEQLHQEAGELLAIMIASINTTRRNLRA